MDKLVPQQPVAQTSALQNPRESDKGKKSPDLGTKIGFIGTAMAIILFLEGKSTWSVVVLLIALFFILLPLVVWSLADLFKATGKRVWIPAILITTATVGIYGWHAFPDTSYLPSHLRQMSIKDLKEVKKKLTGQMREFQLEHDKRMDKALSNPDRSAGRYEYEKAETKFRAEFYERFLVKMSAMREELLWRSGKTREQAERDIRANLPYPWNEIAPELMLGPFSGVLTGASPVANAAAYLDTLAGQLN